MKAREREMVVPIAATRPATESTAAAREVVEERRHLRTHIVV